MTPLVVGAYAGCLCSFCRVPFIEGDRAFSDAVKGSVWICCDCLRQANGEHARYARAEADRGSAS